MRGKRGEMLTKLLEERDRLLKQQEALQNQLIGINRAISLMGGDGEIQPERPQARERVRNMKDTVLGLLSEAGESGLTVIQVLEKSLRHGVHLERNSVSSLLSRLKREDVLEMTDGRYFVKKPSPTQTTVKSA
jgi:hypothetical protein